MTRKITTNLYARVPMETDALRAELQRRLERPLHEVIALAFLALKADLEKRSRSELCSDKARTRSAGGAQ